MNVYDFDKTIYKYDSSVQIYLFLLKKRPGLFLKCFPKQIAAMLKYYFKSISKEEMKEKYFCFLKYIDIGEYLEEFVNKEIGNISSWYLEQKRDDDVIISASPRFIVEAFSKRLNINNVIASEVDMYSGHFSSKNCHGEEKVLRFYEMFPEGQVEEFYSDSESDNPMARIAKRAFLVKGNVIIKNVKV